MEIKEWLGKDNQAGFNIWTNKYQYNGENFEQWLERVSGGDREVMRLIREKKFLFGGRINAGRGVKENCSIANCYVMEPPEDNIESIFETCKKMARTYSYGGGVGVDISNLRPNGAKVNNSAKTSSGAVSFMELLSQVTETIGQCGRRSALLISINCNHPDIDAFTHIKSDLSLVNKANISVRFTNHFMNAVIGDRVYKLHFKNDKCDVNKNINARTFFKEFARMNWEYAEPGCLFWDRIEGYNFLDHEPEFRYSGCNPCCEEPLPKWGACLLGSINLSEYVKTDFSINGMEYTSFDIETFAKDVRTCVMALNDVLIEGIPKHPLKEQQETVAKLRQIGLGIMGIGDMLTKLHIRYGSPESLKLCEKIARKMINSAVIASVDYRLQQPRNLRLHDPHIYWSEKTFRESNFVQATLDTETIEYVCHNGGMFNSQLLTCAPTGSLSTMLGISGGIEPFFAFTYTRKTESLHDKPVYYTMFTPIVQEYMDKHNIKNESQLPDFFVTAHMIPWKERVDMQAVWQKYIDASISSTVNLPNKATVDDVMELYLYAWQKDLKGITIYRDGCARTPVLSEKPKKNSETKVTINLDSEKGITIENNPLKRGDVITKHELFGLKRTIQSGCGSLHCAAYFDRNTGEFVELFLGKGSKGGCLSTLNGLARMVSLSARGGVPLEKIIDQLKSANACPSYAVRTAVHKDTSIGSCCPSAIANALIDMTNEMKTYLKSQKEYNIKDIKLYTEALPSERVKMGIYDKPDDKNTVTDNVEKCTKCGMPLEHTCGCISCPNCGWSKCD